MLIRKKRKRVRKGVGAHLKQLVRGLELVSRHSGRVPGFLKGGRGLQEMCLSGSKGVEEREKKEGEECKG